MRAPEAVLVVLYRHRNAAGDPTCRSCRFHVVRFGSDCRYTDSHTLMDADGDPAPHDRCPTWFPETVTAQTADAAEARYWRTLYERTLPADAPPPVCSTCAGTRKFLREFQPGAGYIEPCPDCDPSLPPVPWPWGDAQRRMAATIAANLLVEAGAGRDSAATHLALDAARLALDLSERHR